MASPLVDNSMGYTIAFAQSGFTAEITDVTPPSTTCEEVDVTHQNSRSAQGISDSQLVRREYKPGDLLDQGPMTFEIHFDPDTDPASYVGIEETGATDIVLTHPSTATWSFAGFITEFTPAAHTLGEKMMATISVRPTGKISYAAGA